ncbi:DDE superfamily endonuclease, partial [Phytophthora infestans]
MAGSFEPEFQSSRSRLAAVMYLHRFRGRNRLSMRRITHQASSITSRKAVQSRILGQQQGSGFSVCLGNLPRMIVFAGVGGGTVEAELQAHSIFSIWAVFDSAEEGLLRQARMLQWIEEVWRPSISGSKLLILDSLKTHKIEFVREKLENGCCTEVEFIPLVTTGITQPLDVSVMREFKRICRDLYHKDHDFAPSPEACRDLITRVVVRVWQLNDADVIVRGFIRAGVVPYGPRNKDARFHIAKPKNIFHYFFTWM